jgi:hypothetical protein
LTQNRNAPDDHLRQLIETFVLGHINGRDFEARFLENFRRARDNGHSIRHAVDLLFYDVDAFCDDASLRGPDDLDENGLRERARIALARWESLPSGP